MPSVGLSRLLTSYRRKHPLPLEGADGYAMQPKDYAAARRALGPGHQAAVYWMAAKAAGAATGVCILGATGLALASLPFLLVLPLLYVISELVFAVIYYQKYAMLNFQPVKHRPATYDPQKSFDRAIHHLKQYEDIKQYLSMWFCGAPFHEIRKGNVAEMVAYAFWYQSM